MKRYNYFLTLMMLIASGCFSCLFQNNPKEEVSVSEKDTYVIKVGHAAAKEHFAQKSFEKFKELVEENSNGQN